MAMRLFKGIREIQRNNQMIKVIPQNFQGNQKHKTLGRETIRAPYLILVENLSLFPTTK